MNVNMMKNVKEEFNLNQSLNAVSVSMCHVSMRIDVLCTVNCQCRKKMKSENCKNLVF